MSTHDVQIETLKPMRVASVWGFGPSPENEAWQKLEAWAKPQGLYGDLANHPIFGFNNPNPSAGSPNYGYELWLQVSPDTLPEGDVRILDFAGGLYAVKRCEVPKGQFEQIGETWKALVTWLEDSKYKQGTHQWLEKSIATSSPDLEFVLDLYLPIAE